MSTPQPVVSFVPSTQVGNSSIASTYVDSSKTRLGMERERLLESALLISKSGLHESIVLRQFRDIVGAVTGVLGVSFASYEQRDWWVLPENSTGITLDSLQLRDGEANEDAATSKDIDPKSKVLISGKAKELFDSAFQRNGVLQRKWNVAGSEITVIAIPITVVGADPEIVAVITDANRESGSLRRSVESLCTVFQLWRQDRVAKSNDWKIATLSAIIDLTDRVESAEDFVVASKVLVNEFASYVSCANVALGWIENRRIRLVAYSGDSSINSRSKVHNGFQQALQESVLIKAPTKWSCREQEIDQPLALMHKSLAHLMEVESVRSWPLLDSNGRVLGAWIFADSQEKLFSPRFARLVDVLTPRVCAALRLAKGNRRNALSRLIGGSAKVAMGWRFLSILIVGVLAAFLLTREVPYQVKARLDVMPDWRRFLVAPFDGQIEKALVHVGDNVEAGQTLAVLDGRNIRWQLLSLKAEKEQALRKREVELASGNPAMTLLADQELKRIDAEESLLKLRLEQLEIKAPISGVILSGSSERAEASSVTIGQPIFEIGAIDSVRIEIAVPAEEINSVLVGAPVRLWFQGKEDQLVTANIEKIRPMSEERLGMNTFIAELTLENKDLSIRPGMTGISKIECGESPLFWNLFHKPWNYVRTLLVW